MRGGVYYDHLIKDRQTERTTLASDGEDDLGYDARIKEALVSFSFAPKGVPVFLRAGRQILNWGETSFLRDGFDDDFMQIPGLVYAKKRPETEASGAPTVLLKIRPLSQASPTRWKFVTLSEPLLTSVTLGVVARPCLVG